jgi:multidrug efflux pump subunit AcrB
MPVQVNKVKITFARRKMTAYGGFALIAAFFGQIGFMGGLTGALFTEFAYTLAGAVAVSAVVALTLSPMMCSRFLKSYDNKRRHRFVDFVDRQFDRLSRGYQGLLREGLNYLPVVGVFAALILVSVYFLYASSKSELAPPGGPGRHYLVDHCGAQRLARADAALQQKGVRAF